MPEARTTAEANRAGVPARPQSELRTIVALAIPLFFNSGLQAALNLTDTWFVGRLSSTAVAAVGASYWLVLASLLVLGGVGMVVQSFAAQAYGARRWRRASHVAWMGLWCGVLTVPVFLALAFSDALVLPLLRLDPQVTALAGEYWRPRLIGGPVAVALWAVLSFFMGIGRVRLALVIDVVVLLVNVVANELMIFHLGLGIAGSAWATTTAQVAGLLLALGVFLGPALDPRFAPRRTWRWRGSTARALVVVGLAAGFGIAFDILGLALFQIMVTQLGPVQGAATQIVMMLTSLAYMPAVGIGMAGTTVVGQAIGAGDRARAWRLGNLTIRLAVAYMGTVGVLIAALGPWLVPLFVASGDPNAATLVPLGCTLLWIAAGYQAFDGLNIGSGFCLRAAGDTRVPAMLLALLSFGVFVPLTHTLAFSAETVWIAGAPSFGLGAVGGWFAALVYVALLGLSLLARWRSRAWQRIRLG